MTSKISTVKRLRVVGDILMFSMFICLLYVFLHAYVNGLNDDDFTTTVDINSKNEAHVEFFILIVVLLPIFFLTTIWSFIDWKATWRARDNIRFEQYFVEPERPRRHELETVLMKCSACNGTFGVTSVENEMTIECPHCNKVGLMKVPSSDRRRPSRNRNSREIYFDIDRSYTDDDESDGAPKVRIIKDIRD